MSRPSATSPGGTAKSRCRSSSAVADLGNGGDLRGRIAGSLGAQLVADVGAVEKHALAGRGRREPHVQGRRPPRPSPRCRRSRRRRLQRRERDEPIQGAAVEVVPAELLREQPADRALARAARAVDRDHRRGAPRHCAVLAVDVEADAARATSRKLGNEVATSAVLRISIGALGAHARDRERHRDAVVAAAVDGAAAQRGRRRCARRRAALRPRRRRLRALAP